MDDLANLYNKLRGEKDFSCVAIVGKENLRTTFTVNLTFAQAIEVFKLVPYDENSKRYCQLNVNYGISS